MGKEAIKISKLDNAKLLQVLNEALAEEWLAYYQYWIGARVIEGPMRPSIEDEFNNHANEELKHAGWIADRIDQLGGTPILDPKEWFKLAKCAYEAPTDPYIEKVLQQNLSSERCAIERYQGIAEMTFGKDYATYEMAMKILDEELEHENDIENWITDIRSYLGHKK